jgi:error-prone DNA polymerase
MGFYQPAQLVRDAREHGVTVHGPDVMLSGWESHLENPSPSWGGTDCEAVRVGVSEAAAHFTGHHPDDAGASSVPPHEGEGRVVRLGLHQVRGLKEDDARALIAAREAGAATLETLARRARLSRRALELLAEADAFRSLGMDRREGLWAVKALAPEVKAAEDAPLLAGLGLEEPAVDLPRMPLPAHVAEDYRTTGLSLKAHPCRFFRSHLASLGAVPTERLKTMKDGQRVTVGGLVLIRQRPGTAKGVIFATLEDETGIANAVVWPDVFAKNRRTVMTSSFLVVSGRLQVASGVIHVVAERFVDLTARLAQLKGADAPPAPPRAPSAKLQRSRDFH